MLNSFDEIQLCLGIKQDLNSNGLDAKSLKKQIAYYVAGKVIVSDALCLEIPKILTIKNFDVSGEYVIDEKIREREWFTIKIMQDSVIATLAGLASTDIVFNQTEICRESDLSLALKLVKKFVDNYFEIKPKSRDCENATTRRFFAKREDIVIFKMKKYYKYAKVLILKNHDFLDTVANALAENGELSVSDYQNLKSNFKLETYIC